MHPCYLKCTSHARRPDSMEALLVCLLCKASYADHRKDDSRKLANLSGISLQHTVSEVWSERCTHFKRVAYIGVDLQVAGSYTQSKRYQGSAGWRAAIGCLLQRSISTEWKACDERMNECTFSVEAYSIPRTGAVLGAATSGAGGGGGGAFPLL